MKKMNIMITATIHTKTIIKNAPIVHIEKKLFICNNVTDIPNDYFACKGPSVVDTGSFYPSAPDSGEYITMSR
jgi:hypothetical protein